MRDLAGQADGQVRGRIGVQFGWIAMLVLLSALVLAARPSVSVPTTDTETGVGQAVGNQGPVGSVLASDVTLPPAVLLQQVQSVPTQDPVSSGVATFPSVQTARVAEAPVETGESASMLGSSGSAGVPVLAGVPVFANVLPPSGQLEFDMVDWFPSYLAEAIATSVVEVAGEPKLEVTVSQSEGALARDVPNPVEAGHSYAASIRAESPSGLPVMVELAVHALDIEGAIDETSSRLVMVEGFEVPITATLRAEADHRSLRVEVYVHTINRAVRFDDASLMVDTAHDGPDNFGYQQPRVRYLDDPTTGPVDPANLAPGGQYVVEVSIETTTDQPWSCCRAVGSVRLGTEDEDLIGGSARTSQLFAATDVDGSNWISPNRIRFDHAESVNGGTFTTVITAPIEPGPFAERFRLVAEDLVWIPGPVMQIIGLVVEDDPEIAEQEAAGQEAADQDIADGEVIVGEVVDPGGFDLQATDIGPGVFTLRWERPEMVSLDTYLVEVQDLASPPGRAGESKVRFFETSERQLVIDVLPGRYSARVVALDGGGHRLRSQDVTVEVLVPAPLLEANVSIFGCGSDVDDELPEQCIGG